MPAVQLLTIALAAGLAACAGVQSPDSAHATSTDKLVNIRLAASRVNSGETAWATLVARGGKTDATIMASGVPMQVSRPIHLYTYIYEGTCDSLPARPTYALTGVVLARSNGATGQVGPPYTVANTVDISLPQLRAKPHAIVVKSAPADGDLSLFCGELAARSPGPT